MQPTNRAIDRITSSSPGGGTWVYRPERKGTDSGRASVVALSRLRGPLRGRLPVLTEGGRERGVRHLEVGDRATQLLRERHDPHAGSHTGHQLALVAGLGQVIVGPG